jgi:hypothetical protein
LRAQASNDQPEFRLRLASEDVQMRRLTSILLIASAAMFFIPGAASASWTCTAHSRFGNHGWGRDSDRSSAASRAMYECSIRGGGCRITSCVSNNPRRGHPCPSGWCD